MERYIGLDAHSTSCTFAVVSERGKRLKSSVVETNGQALIGFLKTVPGRKHLCLEEGTQSGWLHEILSPHVDELVVTHLVRTTRGRKDDLTDAFARAQELRLGTVTPVYKHGRGAKGPLRAHVEVYEQVTTDLVRVQNRLKASYRSRGVSTTGGQVYTKKHRAEYLARLSKPYRARVELLYVQLDALRELKKDARKQMLQQSHRMAIHRVLETCPGMGPVRVAQVLATIITPHRFRSARQLWSYSGLGVVMRSSSDWEQGDSGWQRVERRRTRGLNRNFNRRMKAVFKGAATAVISHRLDPLYSSYLRATEQGTKPPLAKLTLARKLAATVLAMWKNQEVYDPQRQPTHSETLVCGIEVEPTRAAYAGPHDPPRRARFRGKHPSCGWT